MYFFVASLYATAKSQSPTSKSAKTIGSLSAKPSMNVGNQDVCMMRCDRMALSRERSHAWREESIFIRESIRWILFFRVFMIAFHIFCVWHWIETAFWPRIASNNSGECQLRSAKKSKFLETFPTIHTAGWIVSTMTLSKCARPEAMIGGEEELVPLNQLDNNRIHHKYDDSILFYTQ